MAQRTQVILIDDLDGGTADETVRFGLDGVSYVVDLSNKHASALRDALAKYVSAARKEGRAAAVSANRPAGRARGTATAAREQNREMREWLKRQGHDVSERGRIKQELVDLYHAQAGR